MNLTKVLIETSERRVSKAPSISALSLLKQELSGSQSEALAIDCEVKWEVKKWKVKVKVKSEAVFGPLNFFIFGYVKGGGLGVTIT